MPIDIAAVRRHFPYLEQCVYLDTGSAGISWTGQGAAAAKFYDEDKARGYDGRDSWRAQMERCQRQLAQLVNVEPEQISFLSSTSEALNLIARAIPMHPADEVLFAEDEFPSVALAWLAHEATGGRIRRVRIPDESERTRTLVNAISETTRVVCVSHVHSSIGTRVDLSELGAACRARGARLIVDGVQSAGAIPIDASQVDFYASAVFKWLLSGFGLAFVVMNRDFEATLQPALRGYDNEGELHQLRSGHANHSGMYALSATLDFLGSIGWPEIHARVDSLATYLDTRLREQGWSVVTPVDARAGIVSIAVSDAKLCEERLGRRGVRVAERGGFLRATPHFYNTAAEIDRFSDALRSECGAERSK